MQNAALSVRFFTFAQHATFSLHIPHICISPHILILNPWARVQVARCLRWRSAVSRVVIVYIFTGSPHYGAAHRLFAGSDKNFIVDARGLLQCESIRIMRRGGHLGPAGQRSSAFIANVFLYAHKLSQHT